MSRVVSLGVVFLLAACGRGPERVVTTSATAPAAVPTGSKTIDSTGWVDNAGRTSDQRARTEMSGMRATETGGERPTGTPGSGIPLPGTGARAASERGDAPDDDVSGAPPETVIGRIARARCDHQVVCGRVGPTAPWRSDGECMDALRRSVRDELTHEACPKGVRAGALAACLATVRTRACSSSAERLETVPPCTRDALCAAP